MNCGAFARWCGAILFCAVVVFSVRAQDPPAKVSEIDFLKHEFGEILSAIQAGDSKKASGLLDQFLFEHADQWLAATFGPDESPAMEKAFVKLQPDEKKSLMDRLSCAVSQRKTDVDFHLFDPATDTDMKLLKAGSAAAMAPLRIYVMQIREGANDPAALKFGNLVRAETGFRYLDDQVLAALSSAPPMRVMLTPKTASEHLVKPPAQPVYPPNERNHEGAVELHVIIGTDGSVQEITPVKGEAAFVKSAMDAVKQWHYKGLTLNGKPVEVDTHVLVIFQVAH